MRGWIEELIDGPIPAEGETVERRGRKLTGLRGLVRDLAISDSAQKQTRDAFGFKWSKRETYLSDTVQNATRDWQRARYGDLLGQLKLHLGEKPIVLEVGCGAGLTASLILDHAFPHIRYVGVDISEAVEIAAERIGPRIAESFFMQADLMRLPFAPAVFDLVLSEGVLHHTPSTHAAILETARYVRPGGVYAIYVYARKAPAREFTDDFIRAKIAELPVQEAWDQLMPLTKLGNALGDLDIYIDVPEDVGVLCIPKGRIKLQRLFYWYFCKMYHRPDYSLDEMNHVNFDWFMPKYCHRQSPEEVRTWCEEAGLMIERLKVEEAGITVIARRPGAV
jgi:arsenite methyltransferase